MALTDQEWERALQLASASADGEVQERFIAVLERLAASAEKAAQALQVLAAVKSGGGLPY